MKLSLCPDHPIFRFINPVRFHENWLIIIRVHFWSSRKERKGWKGWKEGRDFPIPISPPTSLPRSLSAAFLACSMIAWPTSCSCRCRCRCRCRCTLRKFDRGGGRRDTNPPSAPSSPKIKREVAKFLGPSKSCCRAATVNTDFEMKCRTCDQSTFCLQRHWKWRPEIPSSSSSRDILCNRS